MRENFRQIALELQGQDANFFSRSFSPGSQEYVEAATYFEYLRSGKLATHAMLQADLVFPEVCFVSESSGDENQPPPPLDAAVLLFYLCVCQVTFELSPMDYILGVADLTGELVRTGPVLSVCLRGFFTIVDSSLLPPALQMRKCIGSIGSGLDASLNIANFMRELASGLFSFTRQVCMTTVSPALTPPPFPSPSLTPSGFNALSGNRDLTNKVRVLNESLKKVELGWCLSSPHLEFGSDIIYLPSPN